MQTTLTLQSTLAFVSGIAVGALVTLGSAMAVSSLLVMTTALKSDACVMTIPAEGASTLNVSRQSPGCGVKPF